MALVTILCFAVIILFFGLFYRMLYKTSESKLDLLNIGIVFIIVFFIFLASLLYDSFNVLKNSEDYTKVGPFGDYIGGIINPLISVFAIFAAGFAFYAQYQANMQVQEQFEKQEEREYKSNFETKFFELIKIHRENVSEQNYAKFTSKVNGLEIGTGRKVFRIMCRELEECLKEVFRYRKIYTEEFIKPNYEIKLNNIKKENKLNIDIIDLALIDLGYIIFFFGLGKESEDYLLNNFKAKYDYKYFKRLIKFLQLKPRRENDYAFRNWKKFYELPLERMKSILDDIYNNRDNNKFSLYFKEVDLSNNFSCAKYYGGQQHRLGHYFRHLFQTYKFLFCENQLSGEEKYFYGKTLRAQISTYEQLIFFINSLSSLGHKWDFIPEENNSTKEKMLLISTYNIIKNLPGNKFLDIIYKKYYPNVDFEFDSSD